MAACARYIQKIVHIDVMVSDTQPIELNAKFVTEVRKRKACLSLSENII